MNVLVSQFTRRYQFYTKLRAPIRITNLIIQPKTTNPLNESTNNFLSASKKNNGATLRKLRRPFSTVRGSGDMAMVEIDKNINVTIKNSDVITLLAKLQGKGSARRTFAIDPRLLRRTFDNSKKKPVIPR